MLRAARIGAGLPQPWRRLGGAEVDDAQLPRVCELVTIRVGLRKVVDRIEKQYRDIRAQLPQHVKDDDVLRLKAAGDAGSGARLEGGGDNVSCGGHMSISSRA